MPKGTDDEHLAEDLAPAREPEAALARTFMKSSMKPTTPKPTIIQTTSQPEIVGGLLPM